MENKKLYILSKIIIMLLFSIILVAILKNYSQLDIDEKNVEYKVLLTIAGICALYLVSYPILFYYEYVKDYSEGKISKRKYTLFKNLSIFIVAFLGLFSFGIFLIFFVPHIILLIKNRKLVINSI